MAPGYELRAVILPLASAACFIAVGGFASLVWVTQHEVLLAPLGAYLVYGAGSGLIGWCATALPALLLARRGAGRWSVLPVAAGLVAIVVDSPLLPYRMFEVALGVGRPILGAMVGAAVAAAPTIDAIRGQPLAPTRAAIDRSLVLATIGMLGSVLAVAGVGPTLDLAWPFAVGAFAFAICWDARKPRDGVILVGVLIAMHGVALGTALYAASYADASVLRPEGRLVMAGGGLVIALAAVAVRPLARWLGRSRRGAVATTPA